MYDISTVEYIECIEHVGYNELDDVKAKSF